MCFHIDTLNTKVVLVLVQLFFRDSKSILGVSEKGGLGEMVVLRRKRYSTYKKKKLACKTLHMMCSTGQISIFVY